MTAGTCFDKTHQPAKAGYNHSIQYGRKDYYFQSGIAPLCIFCCAVGSVLWGTIAGFLIRSINMKDETTIKGCIARYADNQAKKEAVGGEKQQPADEILRVLELVGGKITEGAKAFLYKEYVWLTVWSCSFAIVLGTTVDLLEMSMKRAPTNFPYTATSYLTGSTTSIIAGYIGMRIAVYTNTRVTYTCAESCHRGFVTAFRGGQVLGFVLVGLAILNIMIIILIFKACWYNEYLADALAAGMPIDNCPAGSHAGMLKAQGQIWTFFDSLVFKQWSEGYTGYTPEVAGKAPTAAALEKAYEASSHYYTSASATVAAAADCAGDHSHFDAKTKECTTWSQFDLCDIWTATTTTLKHKFSYTSTSSVDEILFKGGFTEDSEAFPNCLSYEWSAASGQYTITPKTWTDAVADYKIMGYAAKARETDSWSQKGAPNDLLKHVHLARGETFDDSFPVPAGVKSLPRSSWIWSDQDQLDCMEAYNAAFYTYKQRICVLTRRMFELVAGYGLGGSSVALFGRVGGGIYTKAADVGADLVGKTLKDLKEDDITNPGTIADNVGDNVGDIAGMGSDLFGSLAESTCAALVVSATSYELVRHPNALFFPIAVTASGTVASWFSVLLAHVRKVEVDNVQSILKF